jgi:hypothetical protein
MRKIAISLVSLILLLIPDVLKGQLNQNTAGPDKRLAIVIGNGKYIYSPELANPVNDARAIRDALQGLGFDVYEYEDVNQAQMKAAIDNFGIKLKNYSTGLFFYAGHGIQSKGANYLIPVDANIQAEQQIEYDCVQADRVLGFMEAAGSKVNIVILDACRNNPFERSWSRSMDGSGLAFMNAPTGSLIAYSTSPGRTASDGIGQNGLYTEALLENLKTPNITILQMFQNVRRTVTDKSYKQQIPWESTSLTADFFFVNPEKIASKSEISAKWNHVESGYYYYLNNEDISTRVSSAWVDDTLLVYDPVSNVTSILPDYENSTKNKMMDAKILGNTSNAYWRSKKGFYFLYVKGKQIAARTKPVFVDQDLLVYDGETNTTYILKDYTKSNDNKLHEAVIFDNADFAFWRKTKEGSYYLYVKGEDIQNRTNNGAAGNDLIVYDTLTNITYLMKDFYSDTENMKLRPASVLSYQDNTFWSKTTEGYWLIAKGVGIQAHTTSKWSDSDLYVTDTQTKITYIMPDYEKASQNQPRVALLAP